MTEQERLILLETEQRSKTNERDIAQISERIKDMENEQKAIYKIATSVELIAQRVSNIEDKVDDTNRKVDAQGKAWRETEQKLTEKAQEIESKPLKQTATNMNSIKVAIITAVCTMLATGIAKAIIDLVR